MLSLCVCAGLCACLTLNGSPLGPREVKRCLRADVDPGGRRRLEDAEVEAEERWGEAGGGDGHLGKSQGEVPLHAHEQSHQVPHRLEPGQGGGRPDHNGTS